MLGKTIPDDHHDGSMLMVIFLSACRFVFCRQRQDEKLRRGGEQKSVVVLSMYPYSSVLSPLSQFAGPLYFNSGPEALEDVRDLHILGDAGTGLLSVTAQRLHHFAEQYVEVVASVCPAKLSAA